MSDYDIAFYVDKVTGAVDKLTKKIGSLESTIDDLIKKLKAAPPAVQPADTEPRE